MKKLNKKKTIVSIVIILILIAVLIFVVKVITTKELKLQNSDKTASVALKYSSLKFEYESVGEQESKLTSDDAQVLVQIKEDLKDWYNSEYEVLKEYRMMAYEGQEREYNENQCVYYNRIEKGCYEVLAQMNDECYLEIQIINNEDSQKSLEETFNQEYIQKLLQTLKIN